MTATHPDDQTPTEPSRAGRWLLAALALLTVLAVVAAVAFRPKPAPPSDEIRGDAFLVKGHELYEMRCVSCHGALGKGDGPISKSIGPPFPGDLSDRTWKHGDQPEQVLKVIAEGVRGTQMAGWASAFSPRELKAVAGYVFQLAGRPVPGAYREGWEPDPDAGPDGS